ncbi:hypothetical protein [Brevundimonas sp. NIBR11]|uniref:hypothetical protein n=1 Tax=Brevundimonas sp. NIBR11 TaxID=3015999 RepID=UPI0022F0A508|nr:hypothetical protein [Brevundimonas sp. NIBR11]WGM32135.1 hypothetical protein KKHFBJBL_02386 [Brevundimonas sp. NIBR11]
MTRLSALALSLLIAAAPLSAATAQDRGGRGDRDRNNGQSFERQERRISEAEAQGIAQSRARGARFVGSLGLRGDSYVFRFERDGQIIDIAVSSRG